MKRPVIRRQFLQVAGGSLAIGLAGCLEDEAETTDDESGDEDDDHDHDHDHDHDDDDENGEEPGSDGLLYAFSPDEIAVVDPDSGEIVDEITDGIDGADWSDPQLTHDYGKLFVGENSLDQLLVIDTASREVIDEVDVGPGVTHIYHPTDDEIWAHADDEGAFYVVDVDSHDVREVVQSGLEDEGHGKLLYHEDMDGVGYATNVNDPGVPVIDLENYERSDFLEFADEDDQGTHYKAYSPSNGLAYVEFGDETVVVDPSEDEVVDTLSFSGGMYLTPDETLMGVLDGDTIRFLDVTDEENEEVGTVEVDGGPDALRYHDGEDGIYAFTANTMDDQGAVIDLESFEVVETITVGDIERPEDAHHLHRSGVAGGGYFLTPAEADGYLTVVDMETFDVVTVEVADGVDTVQYVGDSGVGYTGRIR
ncbi:hypothetical protein [Natrarchaeobaculum aegyptiacum]|uniref:Cell surface protein n=1 Tax=Natrarchaeobaculum aegyptiacum TaxID=745377 RepID=A0A2Z2HZN4_9EURY|nr:hypothetical protein [Natrarchaeobaculum aegyptiacum]ARS90584.1 hypothetical protein B1756_13185 [Natrarchaeobaculum aegyptiacum]